MPETPKQEIKLFYCYAREDKTLRDELEKHMRSLKRLYPLREWHDREILPGEEWEKAIDTNLNSAHLILLLVSPDFLSSDYCYGKEMQRALERHEEGTCKVIPIILRPTYLEAAPFGKLQMLPTDARPITRWSDRDEAFHDVVKEISLVLKDLLTSLKSKKGWLEEGDALRGPSRPEKAPAAGEEAILLNPNYAQAYYSRVPETPETTADKNSGKIDKVVRTPPPPQPPLKVHPKTTKHLPVEEKMPSSFSPPRSGSEVVSETKEQRITEAQEHYNRKNYDQALYAYDRAIYLEPDDPNLYSQKTHILCTLQRYEEALEAAIRVTQLAPNALNLYNEGLICEKLGKYKEALYAYEQAIIYKPDYAIAYQGKGRAHQKLKQYDRAIDAYHSTIAHGTNDFRTYNSLGDAFLDNQRYEEALSAFDQAIEKAIQVNIDNHTLSELYKNKAYAFKKLRRYDEANKASKKAWELEGW